MFGKWLRRGSQSDSNSDLYELLAEQVSLSDLDVSSVAESAELGRFDAMDRASLVELAQTQNLKIHTLEQDAAQLNQKLIQLTQLYERRDTELDTSKRLAKLERERQREAQHQRDQHQIQMKEVSLRIADLETELLRTSSENARLIAVLQKLRQLLRNRSSVL